jgi:hypothetical protein
VSFSADRSADTHVCLGPHFALARWRHAQTLYLDRAYWGDPDRCSLHWLHGGEKHFTNDNPNRDHPALLPWQFGRRAVVLCDYGMDGAQEELLARPHFEAVTVRRHPADGNAERLDWAQYDVAIGRRTTALVDAAIRGIPVVSYDPHSPVAPIAGRVRDIRRPFREQWIRDLAWHNWHVDEIASGAAWDFLRNAYVVAEQFDGADAAYG